MGCSFSGLNGLYDAVNGGGDVWINENRFKIIRQLGEGGFAYVFLVKEVLSDPSNPGISKKFKDPSHISDDGTYAMKKLLIQNSEQLEMVREEIRVSSLFSHPNLLPLLDHAIISVKVSQDQSCKHQACLLFPVHLDGTLLYNAKAMKAKKEFFSTSDVLQIFRQPPLAMLMDFGSAGPSRRQIRSRSETLQLQHVSAPFRAPELWDCPSQCDVDERTDIWSLGCTLYAIMYGVSPFEYALGESGGSLQLAIVNAQMKWPTGPSPPYPEALHQFVTWMLQPQATVRPRIDDILIHVDKLISKFSQ
ncbi:hypothetical protein K7X08_022448 [Anisodus acutangulus]|uniref:non-specific serine/threonine protein kinase n=1 Tax=Anisodus acutangulus TaxID=402998 RepID=A0A9Q1MI10_9SOLA|nr:hypothetical protein K7X08_022448 [Anisodus acutangulus]